MSIMDMFKGQPQQQQQPQGQQQQAPQPAPGNIPQQQAPTDGIIPNQQQQQEQNDDPLANYADLWNTDSQQGQQDAPVFSALDPLKVKDVVAKASFTSGITQEHLEAISQGGEPAMQAFTQALNSVARQVMMQSTVASSKMVEQAINSSMDATNAKFPELMRQHTTASANPLFSNPAVKPVFEAVQKQLSSKYPDASAQQLATMAQDFITAMGQSFNPAAPAQEFPEEQDFSNFLSM